MKSANTLPAKGPRRLIDDVPRTRFVLGIARARGDKDRIKAFESELMTQLDCSHRLSAYGA